MVGNSGRKPNLIVQDVSPTSNSTSYLPSGTKVLCSKEQEKKFFEYFEQYKKDSLKQFEAMIGKGDKNESL